MLKLRLDLTGEEDETVDAELKGIKLFIKRGGKEFTDGMYGHIKILTRKSTPSETGNGTESESGSRTRLRKSLSPRTLAHRSLNSALCFPSHHFFPIILSLAVFRRDPLGQVSMNAALHPTVRCNFEAAENILRVILMEKMTTDGEITKEDVVIYAFKVG